MKVNFHESADDILLKFAVIISKHNYQKVERSNQPSPAEKVAIVGDSLLRLFTTVTIDG